VDAAPRVTGLLEWHGLQVGDPATDLQWLAAAPTAADDVYRAYAAHATRAPDALVRERARLYAELEFAKWLVHGYETDRDDIIDDALGLLASLDLGVRGEDLVPDGDLDVDGAIALLGRVREPSPSSADTSMQTDAYDPEELSLWVATDDPGEAADADARPVEEGSEHQPFFDDVSTAPIAVVDFQRHSVPGSDPALTLPVVPIEDEEREAERASRAAFQRWTSSSSE
jgi:macrolide phosphotransferase